MKKIVINENKDMQDAAVRKINDFTELVNRVTARFFSETSYTLSASEIVSLMGRDPDNVVSKINENLHTRMDRELDILNIKSNLLKFNFKGASREIIARLAKELNVLNNHAGYGYMNNLSIDNDGCLFLPNDKEEMIRDSFRSVITTDAAKQLYDLQNEVAEKLQELNTFIINKTHIQRGLGIDQLVKILFYLGENNQIKINPLEYEMCVHGLK